MQYINNKIEYNRNFTFRGSRAELDSMNDNVILLYSLFVTGSFLAFLWNVVVNIYNKYWSETDHDMDLDFDSQTSESNNVDNNIMVSYPDEEPCVTIVRGLPGSGKSSYVYSLEENSNSLYSICDTNEYFYNSDGEFTFDVNQLRCAENFQLNKFINSISYGVHRIYVVSTFEHPWMYANYVELALLNGYYIKVVEMECTDDNLGYYFNKRSVHGYPCCKTTTLMNSWTPDSYAEIQEPYCELFPGDSIPSHKFISKASLDRQLANMVLDDEGYGYGTDATMIEDELFHSDYVIPCLKDKQIKSINRWELSKCVSNINKKRHTRKSKRYSRKYKNMLIKLNTDYSGLINTINNLVL